VSAAVAVDRVVARDRVLSRERLVLAGAMVLALALRAPFIGLPLGIDEGGFSFVAKAWGHAGSSLYGPYWLDRPPLLVALFKLANLDGAVGVRLLGAAAALALVGLSFHIAREVSGPRAAAVAAVLAAVLTGSGAITAVFTPGELPASVPAAASVAALLTAHRDGRLRWFAAAGALAVCAALVKQSFLDAGAAGAAYLFATAVAERRVPLRRAGAYAAGAALPLLAVAGWIAAAGLRAGALPYALFGFRVDALHVLAGSNLPLGVRMRQLEQPALWSGLVLALPVALGGLGTLVRRGAVAVALAAWLVAGLVGVAAGGSYWPHYLIQLVAPVSVLAGTALARGGLLVRWAVVAAVAGIAMGNTVSKAERLHAHPPQRHELAIARYIRAHARPGDTQYVLYARANLDYYTGLPSPFPYAWSLMDRAVPGAPDRLARLLASPRRPTWLVTWQGPAHWGLDRHHRIRGALRHDYRRVAHVGHHAIYHRRALP
jgi:hypothetical protein